MLLTTQLNYLRRPCPVNFKVESDSNIPFFLMQTLFKQASLKTLFPRLKFISGRNRDSVKGKAGEPVRKVRSDTCSYLRPTLKSPKY